MTDRVELTDAERDALYKAGDHHPDQCDCDATVLDGGFQSWACCEGLLDTFAAAESIVAARVQAEADAHKLTAQRMLVSSKRFQHERDAARAELAAANDRIEEQRQDLMRRDSATYARMQERDALQATLDRVADVLDQHWDWKAGRSLHAAVRAALTPEGSQ